MNNQVTLGSENAPGFPRLAIYPPLASVPGSLDPPYKRGGMGGYPPLLGGVVRGGSHP